MMSGSAAEQAQGAVQGTPDNMPGDIEGAARRMGWKPKDQFRGDESQWVDAATFVSRAHENPAIMAERLRVMDARAAKMERELEQTRQSVDSQSGTIAYMTELVRTSSERTYTGERRRLEAEREKRIEAGDVAGVRVIDAEIADLKAVPAAPKVPDPPAAAPAQTEPLDELPPAVREFTAKNPWFLTDPIMRATADGIHVALLKSNPEMRIEDNLAEVVRRMRGAYPEKFGIVPNAAGRQTQEEEPEEETDANPAASAPSQDAVGRRRSRNARNFASLPEESKKAFLRYKRDLKGKGKELTEDEWAASYYRQRDT